MACGLQGPVEDAGSPSPSSFPAQTQVVPSSAAKLTTDPNFPPDLRIFPSAPSRPRRQAHRHKVTAPSSPSQRHDSSNAAGAAAASSCPSWQLADSTDDIEDYGIAGRIWEAAYLLAIYLDPHVHRRQLEFDPDFDTLFGTAAATPVSSSNAQGIDGWSGPLRILELGAGAGYVGLHLARRLRSLRAAQPAEGAAPTPLARHTARDVVVLTDLATVVPLMRRNAALAGFAQPEPCERDADPGDRSGGTATRHGCPTGAFQGASKKEEPVEVWVRPLPWGDSEAAHDVLTELDPSRSDQPSPQPPSCRGARKAAIASAPSPLTHIVASDLVYFPELLAPLLRTLLHLTSPSPSPSHAPLGGAKAPSNSPPPPSPPPPPQLIISYKVRSLPKEEPFWRALGAWFELRPVLCRRRPHPSHQSRRRRSPPPRSSASPSSPGPPSDGATSETPGRPTRRGGAATGLQGRAHPSAAGARDDDTAAAATTVKEETRFGADEQLWARFGELRWHVTHDLSRRDDSQSDGSDDDDDDEDNDGDDDEARADELYFVLVATRRPTTLSWRPPVDDARLLQGLVTVVRASQRRGARGSAQSDFGSHGPSHDDEDEGEGDEGSGHPHRAGDGGGGTRGDVIPPRGAHLARDAERPPGSEREGQRVQGDQGREAGQEEKQEEEEQEQEMLAPEGLDAFETLLMLSALA